MKNALKILELLANQHSRDTHIITIQESDTSSEATSETYKLISKNKDSINDEYIRMLIEKVLDNSYLKSAFSDSISDILDVFKHITGLIKKIDFVFAVLFDCIYEEKLWDCYGYKSLDSFLYGLPSVYRISRITFINIANAGKIIRHLKFPIKGTSGENISLTPELLHRNYSKLKFLYRIHFVWGLMITYDVLVNFRDLKYRDFNIFVNEYKELHKNLIKQTYHRKSFLTKESRDFICFLHGRPFKVDKLTDLDLIIYKEVRLGHIVRYIYSDNPIFIDSVKNYLQNFYEKNDEQNHQCSYPASEKHLEYQSNTPLYDADWVKYVSDNLGLTIEYITEFFLNLNSDDFRKTFIKKFQNKTELILAQASLIYIIEHNKKLHSSIYDYFEENKIECLYSSLEINFAISVLELNLSYYKWLKRIGNSIPYLKLLKNVNNFTGNFLDKLSYLKTAFENHSENPQLITDAFIKLSAKRFRKFASDKNDDLSHDLINRSDYIKARPIINKVKSSMIYGRAITPITLQSDKQIKLLYDINQIIEKKDIELMEKHPEINWDSEFHAEIEKEKRRMAIRKKHNNAPRYSGLEGLVSSLCDAENEINELEGNPERY